MTELPPDCPLTPNGLQSFVETLDKTLTGIKPEKNATRISENAI